MSETSKENKVTVITKSEQLYLDGICCQIHNSDKKYNPTDKELPRYGQMYGPDKLTIRDADMLKEMIKKNGGELALIVCDKACVAPYRLYYITSIEMINGEMVGFGHCMTAIKLATYNPNVAISYVYDPEYWVEIKNELSNFLDL